MVKRIENPVCAPFTNRPQPGYAADVLPHPLTRDGLRTVTLPAGISLREACRVCLPDIPPGRIAAAVNGEPVPHARWEQSLPAGAKLALRPALHGGDSDPIAAVLTIAVVVAAPFLAPHVLGALGVTATSTALALATAGLQVAGGLIVQGLYTPSLPDRNNTATADPLYSLAGGRNLARPYEPALLVLGRHRIWPDLVATPWASYEDGEQYLHQVFSAGIGAPVLSDWHIGETPVDRYDEATLTVLPPGGNLPFDLDVQTEPGGGAFESTEWVRRTTASGVHRIAIDLDGQLTELGNSEPGLLARSVEIRWRRAQDGDTAAGGWSPLQMVDLPGIPDHPAQNPFRRTLTYDLQEIGGAVDVQIRRTSEPSTESSHIDRIIWAGLRAFRAGTAVFADQTTAAVRIKASGQLNGQIDRLSATASQPVPVRASDGTWSTAQSTNPAWIFRWLALGIRAADGRLIAGAGLAMIRIDEAAIMEWAAWCDANTLKCSAVIDRRMSCADMLALVARCGRAGPTWQNGKLGVIFDDPDTAVSTLITPENVILGSMGVEWAASPAPDEIALRYIDPDSDWQYRTIRRRVPDATGPVANTSTVTLRGITSPGQAVREANLLAARQRYHRRRITWEMGPEGYLIRRGDVVWMTHDMLAGGAAGRLNGGSAAQITLDRARPASDGDHIILRLANGTLHRSAVTLPLHADGDSPLRDLASPLPDTPDADGRSPADILYRIYPDSAPPDPLRITVIEPIDEERVRLTAIDHMAEYYAAETSDPTIPDATPRVQAQSRIRAVTLQARIIDGSTRVSLSVAVAGQWAGASLVSNDPAAPDNIPNGILNAEWATELAAGMTLTVTITPLHGPGGAGAPATATVIIPSAPTPYTSRYQARWNDR